MKKYTIRPISLCRASAEKGNMTYLVDYGVKIWRPYAFWIIEGGGQNIIVDSAIHAGDYQSYRPGFQDLSIDHLLTFEDGLSKASLQPNDIDFVIQTHLHFDHCYNTSKCKNATILVQEDELGFASDPHPSFSSMYSTSLFEGLNFEKIRGREEIFPGIEVIPVPGHTPGCQAVAIDTEAGRAVITGFCCIKENFFPGEDVQARAPFSGAAIIIPGIHLDAFQAYESMMKIKDLADIVLPVHEPEIMDMETIP